LKEFIDSQLAKEYTKPSKSVQTSPLFSISKKDGKKCLIQDYCHLNGGMMKNNYPFSLINNLIHQVHGCDMYTKMNLRWGYNSVRITDRDK